MKVVPASIFSAGILLFSAACLGLALASAPVRADDAPPGKAQFLAACGVCHAIEPGAAARQGPNLVGIYGRQAGTLPDFKYSEVMKAGGWVWDDAALDAWMENAQGTRPGTTMNYRQRDPDKRKLVLAFLKTLGKAP